MQVRSLSWEDLLEEGMAIHSSILAWRIPMDRRAWQTTVHSTAKIWIWLKWLSAHVWVVYFLGSNPWLLLIVVRTTCIRIIWQLEQLKSWGECESLSVVSNSLWPRGLLPARLLCPWNSPGKRITVGSCPLLPGIFPIQGLNPGLQHCRQILYHPSHQGSPSWVTLANLLHHCESKFLYL